MDSFNEQLVTKETTQKDRARKWLIMFGSVALAFAFIFFGMMLPQYLMIGIFLGAGAIYGGYYLLQSLDLEYEYIFTNGDLDIDKIIAKRSRKRLISVKVNDATAVGVAEDFSDGGRTLVLASACDPEQTDYYLDVKHHSYGEVRLIFTPDADTLRVIRTHLPRALRNQITVPAQEEEE